MPSRHFQAFRASVASISCATIAIVGVTETICRHALADEPPAATPTAAPTSSSDPAANKPPRPPPLPETPSKTEPWEHLLDVGGDFAVVARSASTTSDGRPSRVRYQAATGFGLRVRWPIFKYLHVEGYYLDVHMPLGIPQGSLGINATIDSPPVETFTIGARVSPRMTWKSLTGWLTAGAGWGRFEFQRMTATGSSGASFALRERGGSFIEVPMGLGISWEVWPKWISIDLQFTAALVFGERGEAFEDAQTVDAEGHIHNVMAMPAVDGSIVQTFGLSLLL
ncbi:MAG: hypothetical protein IPK82_04840 [Polyangiaceae bacterium]|nr:hypothetical protein [Polyangiaceae bacterium]